MCAAEASVFFGKAAIENDGSFFFANLSMNQTANRRLNSKRSRYFMPSTHTLEKFIGRVYWVAGLKLFAHQARSAP